MSGIGEWWRQPFKADMPAHHWFAFIGLMLIIMALWRIILSHVVGGLDK